MTGDRGIWESMRLTYVGHVGDVLQDHGHLSKSGGDSGPWTPGKGPNWGVGHDKGKDHG